MKKGILILIVGLLMMNMTTENFAASKLPELKFEKYELPNGLDVILHEDHSIPIVAVNIWYHVGSKNEKRGRTGFAHLFEHMMFQGSRHHEDEYFAPLQKIGGTLNGSTNNDRTNYWENVPSNYLELVLWLESDRMGFLLPSMTQKKLDNQRDVVKNERRQRYENQPYNKIYDLMPQLMYPSDHPYSWSVIGSMADLSAASLEDVSEFFRTYYAPNNASLCIAGDFKPEEVKQLVEKYFGPIPSGPPVDRLETWIPQLEGTRRLVSEDNVNLPRLYYTWHTPALYEPGDAEFDLLASILTSGKTSRLYKTLVYDKQIAQDVSAYQYSRELGSTFNIEVTAKEGHTLEELEQVVDDELKKLIAQGVTASELSKAQNEYEAGFVRSLETLGGFSGRADRLNSYNIMLSDPGKVQWDLDRYTRATPADLLRYVKQYMDFDQRGIAHIVPHTSSVAKGEDVDRSKSPAPAAEPSFNPPTFRRAKLSNGLQVLLVEDHKLPLVQMNMVIRSGFSSDPPNLPGTASLTAELLDEGTKTRTALQIADEVKALGAQLSTFSSFDGSQVILNILKRNLAPGLNLMADIVQNPTFPKEELERQRQMYLGYILQESKEPETSARKVYLRTLFGADHPYGQPFTGTGTIESVKAIQQENLIDYYKKNYLPNNAAIVVVGDITLDEAKQQIEKAFANWKPGEVQTKEVPTPLALQKTQLYLVDKPGAAQSMIFAGNLGIRRNDPDYVPTVVMNRALGGKFSSRINMNLREDKGYTYGAGSGFMATRGVGAFQVRAPVQTPNTKESIVEILKELRDVTGNRPLTAEELADTKNDILKGFPQQFQTFSDIAARLSEILLYDLPDDEWQQYVKKVSETTSELTTTAAKSHIHPEALVLVVVGDRAKIEPGLRELGLDEIKVLQAE